MQITRFSVHNVLRISELSVPMDGRNLVLIGGRNGQGKTSAVDALVMALAGKRGFEFPEKPLTEGEDIGHVEVDLHDGEETLTVRRCFERRDNGSVKTWLELRDSAGELAPEPQTLINRWMKTKALDPMRIEDLDAKKQRALLCDLVGVSDYLAACEAEHQAVYEERSGVNARGKAAKVRVDDMPFTPGLPEEEIILAELSSELAEKAKANAESESLEQNRKVAATKVVSLTAKLEQLQARMEKAVTELHEAKAEKEKLDAAEVVKWDLEELKGRIHEAEKTNRLIRQNRARAAADVDYQDLRSEYRRLTENLSEIRGKLQRSLEQAQWPVAGLCVDENGPVYNGLPVSQASTAERMRLWCRVSAALRPELRLLVFRDGNALDNESLAELDKFLQEQEFQAVVEFVTRSPEDEGQCVVVLEDGREK